MDKLAAKGGTPVRTTAFPGWPQHDEAEHSAVLRVLDRAIGGQPKVSRSGPSKPSGRHSPGREAPSPSLMAPMRSRWP